MPARGRMGGEAGRFSRMVGVLSDTIDRAGEEGWWSWVQAPISGKLVRHIEIGGAGMFGHRRVQVLLVGLVISLLAPLSGCHISSPWATYGVFTRPELQKYDRFAVFGVRGEKEQIFMAEFIRALLGYNIVFVERGRVSEVLSEQDALEGRLNETTRARLQQIYGVQALVLCDYVIEDEPTNGIEMKLRIRVLDTETAAIIGSVVVSRRSSKPKDDISDYTEAVKQATRALRNHAMGGAIY